MFEEVFNRMEKNTHFLGEDEVYMHEDGLLHCKKCNQPRQVRVPNINRIMPCICKCMQDEIAKRDANEKKFKEQRKLDKLRKLSLIGDKYKDVNFENTETAHSKEFLHIFNRCKKYCEVSDKVLKQGTGIYLFGNKGTGKSRLTACMANSLLEQFHTVLYTNFSEISKHIRSTFCNNSNETEYEFIESITNVDFLFIDDFGTELVTRGNQDAWLQEKVFEVINKRYNANKPIIFTSNYSLQELVRDRGIADKTVDRIVEMCEVLKLEGTSFRTKIMNQREKLF